MNQFVPQLMLGEPLDGSSGPPNYLPKWHNHSTWCFGAQYFFEVFNNTSNRTEAHAVTGKTYPCKPGEVLYTQYTLSRNWTWTLEMGVKDDNSRVSQVVVEKPFMGLLPKEQTKSWNESVYASAIANTCWEIYDLHESDQYPENEMVYKISIKTDYPGSFDWQKWTTGQPTCPGHPNMSITAHESPHLQQVTWRVLGRNNYLRRQYEAV
mmetsp:Transcript_7495/g.18221  ORF Transcript_7495/g.18221 Transcript_7495/m.18221 type:complete len:209 (+) Transcript_7495:401-1027(+)